MGGGPVWEEGILVGLNPLVTNWVWDLMGLEFSFVLQMSKPVAILKKIINYNIKPNKKNKVKSGVKRVLNNRNLSSDTCIT